MDFTVENSEEVEVIYLESDDEDIRSNEIDHFNGNDEVFDLEPLDSSKITFARHMKSVFCGSISQNDQLAATGGEDDAAFIWSLKDGNLKFECTGHKDSVTYVCFNCDNSLLATGDMAGMIQVWNILYNKLVWCYEGDDLEWLIWHPSKNILMSGNHSGNIFIWQIPQGHCKVLPSEGSPCLCGKILPDGKQLLVGYENAQIKLWDIKSTTVKWNALVSRGSSITSLEISSEGSLCSVAPSSDLIKVADGKFLHSLLIGSETTIEAHLFYSDVDFLITGSLTGQVCVWDLHRHVIRHQVKLDAGITVLELGLQGLIFTGCTDGNIYIFDVRTGVVVTVLTGHKSDILSLTVSHNKSFILSTSDDSTAKIFYVKDYYE